MIKTLHIRGVRGKGAAKTYEDVNFNIPIAEKIHIRYLGNLENPISHGLLDAIKKGQSVVLEISPKYYSTWDYSKS
jgi:hypothetical protein